MRIKHKMRGVVQDRSAVAPEYSNGFSLAAITFQNPLHSIFYGYISNELTPLSLYLIFIFSRDDGTSWYNISAARSQR